MYNPVPPGHDQHPRNFRVGGFHFIRHFIGHLADIFQRFYNGVLMSCAVTKLFPHQFAPELYCIPCCDENIQ